MKRNVVALLLLAAASPALAGSWETSSIRTPAGGLVTVGMPAHEALQTLGPTAHRTKNGSSGKKSGGRTETWNYRGIDGRYSITVSAGQVRKIVVMPDRD